MSIGDAYVVVRAQTAAAKAQVKADMTEAGAEAGAASGRSFGDRFTSTMKTALATVGTLAAGAGLFSLAKSGIQTAASLEQAQVAFTTLIGNAKTAQSFLGDLKSFAAATPFELPGLVDNARLLLGVGVAAKDVIPDLTAWGDAAGALGLTQDRFNSALLAVTQSMGAGKINAQDMNQIINAGIPIWRLMSEATGKSQAELRKLSSEGKLLSSDILPAVQRQMEKDYGGAMAKQSHTLAGVWSTLMDTLHIGLANTLQPLVPILENAIPKAADVLTKALSFVSSAAADVIDVIRFFAGYLTGAGSDAIERFSIGTQKKIYLVAGVISTVVDVVRGYLIPTVEEIAERVVRFAVGVVRLVESFRGLWLPVLGAVIVVIRSALIPAIEATIGVLSTVVNWLASGSKWAGLVRAAIEGMVVVLGLWAAQMVIVRVASLAATAAQWLWNVAMDANPIGLVVLAIAALVAGVIYAYTHFKTFRDIVNDVWSFLKGVASWFAGPFAHFFVVAADDIVKAFHAVVDFFRGLPGDFAHIGQSIVDGLWNGIKGGWSWLVDHVKGLAGDLLNGVKSFLHIGSPSRLFADEVGKWIPAGIQMGIDRYGTLSVPVPQLGVGRLQPAGVPIGNSGAAGGGTVVHGPLVNIEKLGADMSPARLAHEIDWHIRGRG